MSIQRLFILISFTIIGFQSGAAAMQDPLMHFSFNEASGTAYTIEEVSNRQFSITNQFDHPERVRAVQGEALRLDGFSTYAESDFSISEIERQMSVETWYATEAFSPSTDGDRRIIAGGALISQIQDGAGFALKIGPYGSVVLDFHADEQSYEVSTPAHIQKYVWNHIVATIDLDARQALIYVNGSLWSSAALDEHVALSLAHDVPMYLGRHNIVASFVGFNLNTLNGAIDDLKVFNTVLSPSEILERYESLAPALADEVLFEDFESPDYGSWTVVGDAFGSGPARGALANQHPVEGYRGEHLASSFHEGDAAQGKISSPEFTIEHDLIQFLVGGGNHPGRAEIRLRVDGEIVRAATGINAEVLAPGSWDVRDLKGATAKVEIVDSVSGDWGHILVDHITFSENQELLEADLNIDPAIRHADDHLRPQYHAMPNTSWTNEAYGLTYHNEKYHLFFQKNPNGPYLHFMHWGHLSSPDMVHWQEEKIALAPSPGFDDFGIWSGATIKDRNEKPVIFYTGVNAARAAIGMARPKDEDLIEWEKHPYNPLVPQSPEGFLDFRDPFVWEDNGSYYMIVGAGLKHNGGGALPTYKSNDLENWTRIDILHRSSNLSESGFFWEMPLFFPLNDEGDYILSVTPLFSDKPASVIYWIGKWENESFEPYFTTPRLMEPVRDNMLAPAIGQDAEGRINYIGIIPETRSEAAQLRAGWRHAFSLPRVIRLLEDSSIGHYPHPNLCRLRSNEISVEERSIEVDATENLPEFGGNQNNLKFQLKADSASVFELQVLKNAEGSQFTSFAFDLARNRVALDSRRAHEGTAESEYKEFEYVFDHEQEIRLEVFIDHSIVEVFIDNLLVLSARSYPAESSQHIDLLLHEGGLEVVAARQWDMQPKGSQTGMEICEPDFLPTEFRRLQEDQQITGIKKNEALRRSIKLYPNPASEKLQIELPNELGEYEASIVSMDGSVLKTAMLNASSVQQLNTQGLENGVYLLKLKGKSFTEFYKIIIQRK